MTEVKGKPIVVAVDGSPPSWEALETAISLARLVDRPLDILRGEPGLGRAGVPPGNYGLGTVQVFRDHLTTMSTATQRTISPVDGRVLVERPYASGAGIDRMLSDPRAAQRRWREVPVVERAAILGRFCDAFESKRSEIAAELTYQMGRPLRYAPNEVGGTLERARYMIALAEETLADIDVGPKPYFVRFIRREPLGVVFTVAGWNYPYLIAVNSVVPALMAGNAVLLKHSAQTPLCAERFAECFAEAGLPAGLFEALHLSHEDTTRVIGDSRVDFVALPGPVAGGHTVQRAASSRFVGTGLELGGCDPAYVRHDANLWSWNQGL